MGVSLRQSPLRITTRTKLLQVQVGPRWKWIFCYVSNTGRIATTADYRKAIPDAGDNLAYFQGKTSAKVRAIRPDEVESGAVLNGA